MAAPSSSLTPPPPAAAVASTTLSGNLTASSLLSITRPRLRLAASHRRAVVAAAASPRPPPTPEGDGDEQEVERAMGMDGGIPGTSGEFLRRVSSRAYGMRRHLMESLDSLAYDGDVSWIL
jgi:hypothetical protein